MSALDHRVGVDTDDPPDSPAARSPSGSQSPDTGAGFEAGSAVEELAARVLFAPLRQRRILEDLAEVGRVEVARLATEFRISGESIRKDLVALEKQGLLRRVHGGAIAVDELSFEPPVEARTAHTAEKQAIARAALRHVPLAGSVVLDAGSTTAQLADCLVNRDLVVCTNSLPIASSLAARPGVTVRSLGGMIRPTTMAGVGQVTLEALAATNVDVVFIGANGVSVERGCTTPDEQEATVKRRMLPAGRRRILLADHSKFGHRSLFRYAELADFDLVITDSLVAPADVGALERAGVELEIAQ